MAENGADQVMTLEEAVSELIRRFDLIIGLLVEGPPGPEADKGAEAKTVRLARIGMRPIEIARLTGRHESNVNRDLSKARKDGRLPKVTRGRLKKVRRKSLK
jgi:hypothetical protein